MSTCALRCLTGAYAFISTERLHCPQFSLPGGMTLVFIAICRICTAASRSGVFPIVRVIDTVGLVLVSSPGPRHRGTAQVACLRDYVSLY
jgi:hypothetical protein